MPLTPAIPTIDEAWPLRAPWYAVYVSSRHEKKVQAQLELRRIESFLPLYKAVHQWKNRCRKTLELPLFPNYLFVRMGAFERIAVLQVGGVVAIVGRGREAAALPESLIHCLRAALGARTVEPHPYLVVGHRVRIKAGPLAGIEGILQRKKDDLRVVLTVDQIMQSTAIEVAGDEVEDVGALKPARSC